MTNLDGIFHEFISKHVMLRGDVKNNLKEKKRLNVERIKDGLKKYDSNYFPKIRLAEEPLIQGSVGMSTTIQNPKNEFDIDVSLVFDYENIPEDNYEAKKVILESLKYNNVPFSKPPEIKKNCVTIYYADGYHVDFAVYRRKQLNSKYYYEHCGESWSERDPRGIQKWFSDEVCNKKFLREHVRLVKMYCQKNKNQIEFPGGLILSVLLSESYVESESFEESFYLTLESMSRRILDKHYEVLNPTNSQNLIRDDEDIKKICNFEITLSESLKKLSSPFEKSFTNQSRLKMWHDFFKHDYWSNVKVLSVETFPINNSQKISNYYPIRNRKVSRLVLTCHAYRDGNFVKRLDSNQTNFEYLEKGLELKFNVLSLEKNSEVIWKIKNTGKEAIENNCLRGELIRENETKRTETTSYSGKHYVEVYEINQGECISKAKVEINIP